MKLKLLVNLPVDPIHGMTEGRVLDVKREGSGRARWFVMGDQGEEVGVLSHEATLVPEDGHQEFVRD